MTNPVVHGRAAGFGRGLGLGLLAGTAWAGGEWTLAYVAGSVAPSDVWALVLGLDLTVGAVTGAVVGLLSPGRANGSGVGLAVVLAFGFARIVAPPGIGGEALYALSAVATWVLVTRIVPASGRDPLGAMHVALLGLVAIVGGGLFLDSSHAEALRGVQLIAAVIGAPVACVLADRAMTFVLAARGKRVVAQALLAGLLAAVWGRPLDVAPLVDDVVTGVPPGAQAPDVVLVSLDTTRADHLSTYGYERETSPNLTRFAADALLYREARSPAAWTLPAHASMMTGLFPRHHGAHLAGGFVGGESIDGRRNVAHRLAASKVTIAEVLRDRGYRTAAFIANFSYLYRDYGLAQGFGVYDDAPGVMLRIEPPMLRAVRLVRPAFAAKPFRTARQINAAALAWLDRQDRSRPAFLFVNYMEPHQPWVAEPPFDRWARSAPGSWALARKDLYTHAVRDVPEEVATFIRANYDGQLAAMDAALGELLAALKARGRYENALVIVTADHGELLGEHSEMGHMGRTLYEPLLRVPLVVKDPGSSRRTGVVEYAVQLVDLVPTIAEATGAPTPDPIDGLGLEAEARVVYAEEGINPFLVSDYGAFYDRAMRVVYDGSYKLLATSRGERLLFDLEMDPGEDRHLASSDPGRLARLQSMLDERDERALASQEMAQRWTKADSTEKNDGA